MTFSLNLLQRTTPVGAQRSRGRLIFAGSSEFPWRVAENKVSYYPGSSSRQFRAHLSSKASRRWHTQCDTAPLLWSALAFAPTSEPPSVGLAAAVIFGLPAALWMYKAGISIITEISPLTLFLPWLVPDDDTLSAKNHIHG